MTSTFVDVRATPALAANTAVSFVIITKNEGPWLQRTVAQLVAQRSQGHEIVVLDDGSTDTSADFLQRVSLPGVRFFRTPGLGVARARNAAALAATGRVLIFVDAHMSLRENWWRSLVDLLDQPSVGAVQPAITDVHGAGAVGFGERFQGADLTLEWLPARGSAPYAIPVLCGCCFAVRRDLFIRIGGLDGGMIGWGSEDCEFSLRLWRLGYACLIDPTVIVGHLFRKSAPYAINWFVVLHNRIRIALAHFSPARTDRVLWALRGLPGFEQARAHAIAGDALEARRWLDRYAVRDDDSFLQYSGKTF